MLRTKSHFGGVPEIKSKSRVCCAQIHILRVCHTPKTLYIIGLGPNRMYSLHGTRLVALLFRTSDIYTHVLTGLQDGLPTLQPSQHRTASSADYKNVELSCPRFLCAGRNLTHFGYCYSVKMQGSVVLQKK